MKITDLFKKTKLKDSFYENFEDDLDYENMIKKDSKGKIKNRIILLASMILIFIFSAFGGYYVYNYEIADTAELNKSLAGMQADLNSLSESVSSNYKLLDQEENKELLSDSEKQILNDFENIEKSILEVQLNIDEFSEYLQENNSILKEDYIKLEDKYETLQSDLDSIFMQLSNILIAINEEIDNLKIKNADDSNEILTKLIKINEDLTSENTDLQASIDKNMSLVNEKLTNTEKMLINRIDDMEDESITAISSNQLLLTETIKTNQNQLTESFNSGQSQLNNAISQNQASLNDAISSTNNQLSETINSGNNQLSEAINSSNNQLSETINSTNNQLNEVLNTNQTQLNETLNTNQTQLNETLNTNQTQLNETLNTNHSQLKEAISTNQTKIDNSLTDISLSISSNNTNLENHISTTANGISLTLANDYEQINQKLNSDKAEIKDYIGQKANEVFQSVTSGKKQMIAALVTKYNLMGAIWNVNGVNVASMSEVDWANLVSFSDIKEGINNLPESVTITNSYSAGDISYKYHYHTKGDGTCTGTDAYIYQIDNPAGCYVAAVNGSGCEPNTAHTHNKTGQCNYIQTTRICGGNARNNSSCAGGEYNNGWFRQYQCETCGGYTTVYAKSFEELPYIGATISCTCEVLDTGYYDCGYYTNTWKCNCGYTDGQITEANIVWTPAN